MRRGHSPRPVLPPAVPLSRRVKLHHDLPVSASWSLVRLLDVIDVCGCEHCEDFRYAVVAFIHGLSPLEYVPDVLAPARVPNASHNGAHLVPGVPV